MLKQLEEAINKLRDAKPLILNLTNYVTMDFMANSLLALGAAPIMSVCDEELEELVQLAHAININIGTLEKYFITRAHQAVIFAKRYHKPLILDPVGSGASCVRTKTARELMLHMDIIRGNASEILSLGDNESKTLGVESLSSTDQAKTSANSLAQENSCTIVVSGQIDFITDSMQQELLIFGSPLMSRVTGMGCALTGVIAAFRSVIPDSFLAAKLATSYFGLCGNVAASKTDHPGTFRTVFIDELSAANFESMKAFCVGEWL